jgi:hypothetical protein
MPISPVLIGFVSLFVPFLGIIGLLSKRAYHAAIKIWVALVVIFFFTLVFAGGGLIPIENLTALKALNGPIDMHQISKALDADSVTKNDIDTWNKMPWVRLDILISLSGLAIATTFLGLTWAYRNRKLSRPLKFLTHTIEACVFLILAWQFLIRLLIPYLRQFAI